MHTDYPGSDAECRSCPKWSVHSHRGSAAQPEAGLTAGKRSGGGRSFSHLASVAVLRSSEPSSKEQQAAQVEAGACHVEAQVLFREAVELVRFECRALECKAAELEEELKGLSKLWADNQHLKEENVALICIISKLSK
ncbi:Protein phosphatase 1 regulatory subunit 12C [Myotis davidii]|uniref:Protein phosphatase 1 regulatory subunit 12C n=1 Tax=Myotis davidii TaxID=225400 RepID=L5MH80_MYODS|nr:Protein phosphatase 1 regulatory subunit 12C [Myotis davidii]